MVRDELGGNRKLVIQHFWKRQQQTREGWGGVT